MTKIRYRNNDWIKFDGNWHCVCVCDRGLQKDGRNELTSRQKIDSNHLIRFVEIDKREKNLFNAHKHTDTDTSPKRKIEHVCFILFLCVFWAWHVKISIRKINIKPQNKRHVCISFAVKICSLCCSARWSKHKIQHPISLYVLSLHRLLLCPFDCSPSSVCFSPRSPFNSIWFALARST